MRGLDRAAIGTNAYDGLGGLRRLLVPVTMVLAMLVLLAPQASASIGWCRTDPAVDINGQTVNIFISSTEEAFSLATGATQVNVTVPLGVTASLLWTDGGFGYGESVNIQQSSRLQGTQVMVSVILPAGGSLPVLVEVVGANGGYASAQGSTNAAVRVVATL